VITTLRCQNYRGFRDFTISGLSRVNLLIGTNNSGKTSLVAALASGGLDFPYLQFGLSRSGTAESDRQRFWTPLFHEGDEQRGLKVEVSLEDGQEQVLELRSVS